MSRATRLVWSLVAGVALSTLLGCSKPPRRPSFLLVSIDTLRADRLGCYGYERDTTPTLDALAARGYRFDQCATVSENTLISHASMFTGLDAEAHGVTHLDGGRILHANFRTIAEDFRDAGYQTAGFNSHGAWLNEAFEMHQGFDVFVHGHDDAEALLAKVDEWLDGLDQDRPFFLFVHLFDVHSDAAGRPYAADPPFFGRWTGDYTGAWKDWVDRDPSGSSFLNALNDGEVAWAAEDAAFLSDAYDEGLAQLDATLGRFLDGSLARMDDAWVTITSDHGEEFGEHGRFMHGTPYDGVQRVPLLIVPPALERDRLGEARALSPQVTILELRPTLLGLAGVPAIARCQGRDLGPWLSGRSSAVPDWPAVFKRHAVRLNGLKHVAPDKLFDLVVDPGETRDIASDRPEDLANMQFVLRESLDLSAMTKREVLAGAPEISPERDPARRARLEELGYLGK